MNNPNILLVDDDVYFLDILGRALSRRGYNVVSANNIEQALSLYATTNFDYAVIDLRIGDQSGLSLVKQLGNTNSGIRIVMLTGYASIATAVEAIKLGATHYLTKPAEIDEIISAFDKDTGDETIQTEESPISVQRMEWEYIQKVLTEHEGNISATARALNMHRRTLQRKLQKHPVKR